ncbi:MAG: hypothetical protein ACHWZW_08365 [Spirulina sp.]
MVKETSPLTTSPLTTMGIFNRSIWVNALGLLPGTLVTVLAIAVAFLRFYDTQDFALLGFIAQPRLGRNRFTVAALLATLANFGVVGQSPCVAWNRRNCLKARCANEKQTAWLKKHNEDLRKSNEEYERKTEEIRKQNERLAELESKIDGSFSKYGIYSTPVKKPKQP